jgi:hypothetical protein
MAAGQSLGRPSRSSPQVPPSSPKEWVRALSRVLFSSVRQAFELCAAVLLCAQFSVSVAALDLNAIGRDFGTEP